MRTSTVRSGLSTIIVGVVVIMAATLGHAWIGRLFSLPYESEMRFILGGLFWGGMLGGLGAVVTVAGFFRAPGGRQVRVLPLFVLLAVILFIYFVLFYSRLEHPSPPRIRPGETITI